MEYFFFSFFSGNFRKLEKKGYLVFNVYYI